ncbi:MAG: sugar transporter permease [Herbinix sp.]|jgi:putative aldouronate transport system permease protein|nr:sugar transporter permease [Herbinix sp.]
MKQKQSKGDRIFTILNTLFMLVLVIITAYPMYHVLCASFSNNTELVANPGLAFWPKGFTTGAYRLAFQHPLILSGFKNSILILIFALPLNMLLTLFAAYFMASKNLMFKKVIVFVMMFTMFFGGGLIPMYLNQRSLGLYNNLAALIIPGALSMFNAIICKTAIENLPDSLSESAYIDGANDIVVLFRIIAPLIMPTIAVVLLYYAVGHWNNWFHASIFIEDNKLLPIQNILRSLLIMNQDALGGGELSGNGDRFDSYTETIKYAAIIITTVPILCIYPFLQRFFVKGITIGAVKG